MLLVEDTLRWDFPDNCWFVQPPLVRTMVQHVPFQKCLVVVFLPMYVLKIDLVFEVVISTHVAFVATHGNIRTACSHRFVVRMSHFRDHIHDLAHLCDRKLCLILPENERTNHDFRFIENVDPIDLVHET